MKPSFKYRMSLFYKFKRTVIRGEMELEAAAVAANTILDGIGRVEAMTQEGKNARAYVEFRNVILSGLAELFGEENAIKILCLYHYDVMVMVDEIQKAIKRHIFPRIKSAERKRAFSAEMKAAYAARRSAQ